MNRAVDAPNRSSAPSTRQLVIGAAWGFAEATFFFIVPDFYLTRVALSDLRRAFGACVAATAGALIGGAALWIVSHQGGSVPLLHLVRWLPGISDSLIGQAGRAMSGHPASAMLIGAFTGVPFKLFAIHAGAQGISISKFLLVGAVARLARFVTATLLAGVVGRVMCAKDPEWRHRVHLLFWIVFYTWYFLAMG